MVKRGPAAQCEQATVRIGGTEPPRLTAVLPDARAGIPAQSFGPLDEFGALPLRDFGAAHPDLPRRQRQFEHTPTLVILYTMDDQPPDWLCAGQAMERVLLTATVRGVATTPISAPTEEPELRALLGDEFGDHVAQVILRLGYGDPMPSTPRRSVTDFVEVIEPASLGCPDGHRNGAVRLRRLVDLRGDLENAVTVGRRDAFLVRHRQAGLPSGRMFRSEIRCGSCLRGRRSGESPLAGHRRGTRR